MYGEKFVLYSAEKKSPDEVQNSSTVVLGTTELNININNNTVPPAFDEDKAATIIQSHYRGFVARNRKSESDSVFISDEQPEHVNNSRAKLGKRHSQREIIAPVQVNGDAKPFPGSEIVQVAEPDSHLETAAPADDTREAVNETVEIAEQDSKLETVVCENGTCTLVPVNESVEKAEQYNQLETAAQVQDVPESGMPKLVVSNAITTAVRRLSLQEGQETTSETTNENDKPEGGQTEDSQETDAEQSEYQVEIHLDTRKQIESNTSSTTNVADEVLWTSKHLETAQSTSDVTESTAVEDKQGAGSVEFKDEASLTENSDHQSTSDVAEPTAVEDKQEAESVESKDEASLTVNIDHQDQQGMKGKEDDKEQTEEVQEIQPTTPSSDGDKDKQTEINIGEDPIIMAQEENKDQTQEEEKQPSDESSVTEKTESEGESNQTDDVPTQAGEEKGGNDSESKDKQVEQNNTEADVAEGNL